MVLIVRRWGVAPVITVAAMLSIVLSTISVDGALWAALTDEHNLPVRLVQFVAGVACARLFVAGRLPSPKVLWAVTLLGGLVAVAWSTAALEPGRVLVWAVPCATVTLLVAGTHGRRLARTPLERWGLGSYSFYIVHQPMILVLGPLSGRIDSDVVRLLFGLLLALPATAAVAWGLYVLVERPSHRYGRRHYPLTGAPARAIR